jgi:hypothetical protein
MDARRILGCSLVAVASVVAFSQVRTKTKSMITI